MCDELAAFLDSNGSFNAAQHGFRKDRTTKTAMTKSLNRLYAALDRGEACLGIFADLTKTLDLVDHEILPRNLYSYGIRATLHQWITSYLDGRRQYVEMAGERSSLRVCSRGVPQGSLLGPLVVSPLRR